MYHTLWQKIAMARVAGHCFIASSLWSVFSLISAFKVPVIVTPGEDVLLQCQVLSQADIGLLEWIKPDLKSEGYVFFYRNGRAYDRYQHPSFLGRVELRDPEMKEGDVSVFLKNVTINDTGTFQCYVGNEGSERQLIRTITVTVSQPGGGGDKHEGNTDVGDENDGGQNGGKTDGSRQYIGLIAALLVAIVMIFVLVFAISKRNKKKSHLLSDDEACEKHPVSTTTAMSDVIKVQ